MIKYPKPLKTGDQIAVTAPSSGVEESLHILLSKAKGNVEEKGFSVIEGDTIWTEYKAKSSSKEKRTKDFISFLKDDSISAIIPPWGGQLSMEMLPLIDWNLLKELPPKWILGYSDISTLSFVYTTITGNASAHGTNFVELSAPKWDAVTSKWTDVLGCSENEEIVQYSSDYYQSSWEKTFKNPGTGFYFDKKTEWKSLSKNKEVAFSGRLLGGVVNTLQILIGTPFDKVDEFISKYTKEEGVVWYLETVGMTAAEIYRALWQMKFNGWFKNTNGILLGRASGYAPTKDFTLEDALIEVFGDEIPVIYDVDIGHMPPQNILVNGAVGQINYS
ncbi:muramoyltetrapeptide carboxypeptidase LdcA involved in peptidoglycan recycling [Virgibacillus halotolerans]|uniref:S66 family peptidase n=1 Tax=Virgibacillus halotolerans TaxID=1071053 RepID=UPI00195F3B6B|nr:S66 peptidase family protein [Virgibacillus halotolerans]MBM7601065.1 muramoyltetrapeptide carboxypeptidase LdcA involved in peptidoglycan recycling [Virgibacillus halotolerans]